MGSCYAKEDSKKTKLKSLTKLPVPEQNIILANRKELENEIGYQSTYLKKDTRDSLNPYR